MTYRKIRKAYIRKFGCSIFIKLSKHGMSSKKMSKKVTAHIMNKAIYKNRPYLGIIGFGNKQK